MSIQNQNKTDKTIQNQDNTDKTIQKSSEDKCVDRKVGLFRKEKGEDALIRHDMIEEWENECKSGEVQEQVSPEKSTTVFPNSYEYRVAQEFFTNNPQKLKNLISSIDLNTYGKCLTVVTQWDIGIMMNQVKPDKDTRLSLAAQWVALGEARKNLMNHGITDNELSANTKYYGSTNDIGRGDVNFVKWNVECVDLVQNAINK